MCVCVCVCVLSSGWWLSVTCLPFGRPSCCISLSSEFPSTECLAALDRIKAMAATEALMSLVSNLASEVNLVTFSY